VVLPGSFAGVIGFIAGLFNESREFSWGAFLISSSCEVRDRVPVHLVEVEPDRNPTSGPEISRHKESIRVIPDESLLFAAVRLAAKADYPVSVMIKEVIAKNLFANAKRNVLISGNFKGDFR
jgi:hypothetical protein